MVKESNWQLHTYMRKKGYRMPAGEEKYKLPTPQENKEFDTYEKKILDKAKGLGKKAEEETTPGSKPLQTMKPSDKIKARLGDIKSLTRQLERTKNKAEEEEKVKTSEMKKMIQDHLRSPESLLDDWKPGAKIPKIKHAPFASSDEEKESVKLLKRAEEALGK